MDVMYIFDEPSAGLHMSDIGHLLAVINRLVDSGNTVLVVEHDPDVIKVADWIIDLGPEGGSKGGRVMFAGTPHGAAGCQAVHHQRLPARLARPARC